MKTQQEVEQIKEEIQSRIEKTGAICNSLDHASAEWYESDRAYANLIAQYNILIEVLK